MVGEITERFFFFRERAVIGVHRFLPNHLVSPDCKQLHTSIWIIIHSVAGPCETGLLLT